ncbi:YbaB/EbfC family nucleoid-associated protein [Mycoplasma sp. 744]|uniref:YbaB/EbfC family nucleoid-associated protein n=1 Tax=Mycoplasma sp. 744 TaxID=3108531 RepID=UPI002B1E5B2C|nr:YbaB/EbfC family nucleoid-associated protein [Mycoplasma sp. 744]MEA4115689.1 YbaB/EbfC family nucleoid-associated protein [Mycoplasma sp. 744]
MDQGLLRKLQKIQKEAEIKEEAFLEKTFSIEKQGIEVIAKGSKQIVSIKIKETILLDPEDAETLEDLITLTINDLFLQIDEEHQQIMPNIPGFGF